MEAYHENFGMEWQKHQSNYKEVLTKRATTEQETVIAENFKTELRQIILPEYNRTDRCVTCHIAMEDSRTHEMPNPLKTHPGDYLENHEVYRIGCTFCHDGQGRAIDSDDAHALGADKYWGKPLLMKPFQEANCFRCHESNLEQTPSYNRGSKLFKLLGCPTCHKVNERGGSRGPDLSNIGNESYILKAPTARNRDEYLKKFNSNVNLAYLYESIKLPGIHPPGSIMPNSRLPDSAVIDLMVFLKSLSTETRPMLVKPVEDKEASRWLFGN
jgi:cytochrome c553